MTVRETLQRNLDAVEARIAAACAKAGRRREDVTLVAVTKYVGPEVAALLPELGARDLGESRPQEFARKVDAVGGAARWHMIGHLQRNKIDLVVGRAAMIHSVDSVRLLEALERERVPLRVLLEFNCSGEESKSGFTPAEAESLADVVNGLHNVAVAGLMTMAADGDPESARPTFKLLRELRDRLRPVFSSHHTLGELSMGMSNDFEVAIEEGATLVRVGSLLFEGLT